jgi:uncharacterized protein
MPRKKRHTQKASPLTAPEISVSDFVLMTLQAFGGCTEGKTLLQKRVYFVGVLTEDLDSLGYRPHFYGPYSAEVANAVGSLRALGFVREIETERADRAGFGNARYDFSLTRDGEEIATPEPNDEAAIELRSRIQAAADRIKAAGDPNYVALSIAAKTHLLLHKSGGNATTDRIADLAKQFNWQITEEQVAEAASFLEKLKLVRVSKN